MSGSDAASWDGTGTPSTLTGPSTTRTNTRETAVLRVMSALVSPRAPATGR